LKIGRIFEAKLRELDKISFENDKFRMANLGRIVNPSV
jgi:hypothetical protein